MASRCARKLISGNNGPVATEHETVTAPSNIPSGAVHAIPAARLNRPKGKPDHVAIGVWIWLASELMFFAAVFAVYFWIRNFTNERTPAGETPLFEAEHAHLDIPFALTITAVLVLSSVSCQLAANAAEAGKVTGGWLPWKWGMREAFIVTFLLGSIFIGGQVTEYFTLFSEGYFISTNVYWSAFFLATGFHGIHVIGGLIAFLYVLARSYMTRTHTHEQTVGAHVISYYWHFVDVIWVVLFGVIYLLPLIA